MNAAKNGMEKILVQVLVRTFPLVSRPTVE